MEDPEVFEALSRKVLEFVGEGLVDGLRIDHPDGLAFPARYLRRLREAGVEHVWVEKILEPGEPLREWPVEGTTGYEFLNDSTALFVDPEAEEPFTELYRELTGETRSFGEIAAEAKLEQARGDVRDRGRVARRAARRRAPATWTSRPRWPRSTSTAPTSTRTRARWTASTDWRSSRRASRPSWRRSCFSSGAATTRS